MLLAHPEAPYKHAYPDVSSKNTSLSVGYPITDSVTRKKEQQRRPKVKTLCLSEQLEGEPLPTEVTIASSVKLQGLLQNYSTE